MDFTQAQSLLTFGIMLVVLFATPIYKLNNYIKAHTRNEHIKTAVEMANQAVAALVNSGVNTEQNKQKAVDELTQRIASNKLAKNFSKTEIESYVEQAIQQLNK
ncbi:phage holin, LLH family [Fructobacillus americanaquae]|uniref:Phage holin, LLH family n=1 Tax=Fructobacillus americanaquae TaxID=2940302 RepID=A0ABY5C1J7_9LACO|nr:phage holin, LLH family [Fructobacillus americanaquae]USS92048.1 phage holin, LLH family [Fructobacillus americanaquae]